MLDFQPQHKRVSLSPISQVSYQGAGTVSMSAFPPPPPSQNTGPRQYFLLSYRLHDLGLRLGLRLGRLHPARQPSTRGAPAGLGPSQPAQRRAPAGGQARHAADLLLAPEGPPRREVGLVLLLALALYPRRGLMFSFFVLVFVVVFVLFFALFFIFYFS